MNGEAGKSDKTVPFDGDKFRDGYDGIDWGREMTDKGKDMRCSVGEWERLREEGVKNV